MVNIKKLLMSIIVAGTIMIIPNNMIIANASTTLAYKEVDGVKCVNIVELAKLKGEQLSEATHEVYGKGYNITLNGKSVTIYEEAPYIFIDGRITTLKTEVISADGLEYNFPVMQKPTKEGDGFLIPMFVVEKGLGIKGTEEGIVVETPKEDEKEEVRYSASDIIYRPFGFITCAIIKKNTLQAPVVSKIAYIPKELNDLLDKQIDEYNEIQAQKAEEAEQKIHDMYDDKPSTAENPILEDAVVMDNNNQFKDIISTPDIEDNDIKAKSKNSVVIGDDDYLQGTAFNPNVVDEVEDDFV